MMTSASAQNRLAAETSPYLLQHAHNPVDWHAWGAEALELARREAKPILLSIGYSACHWCHVMAHESFEDTATAQVMNALFINIKVDREERPDLDKIYQAAQQLLTGRTGGWPLTMFLTPDTHTPFFGGTYFPPEPRYGMPSFQEVLNGVANFYRERQPDIQQQVAALMQAFDAQHTAPGDAVRLSATPLQSACDALARSYDAVHGGFGRAPKFPHPTHLDRLLRQGAAERDRITTDMALHTLRAMARGGIYDHLGGGFCRYSVDERWAVPHFEKMLYDNGPLLCLYAQAWRVTAEELFQRVARETAAWVRREMQSPEGGYYSTLDADSEGEEGKFFIWTPQQVRATLNNDAQYALVARHYGLNQAANFEGHWHLQVTEDLELAASALSLDVVRARELLGAARDTLFAAREQRIHPGCDQKILTAWNGLMIKGMATMGRTFADAEALHSAERALRFVQQTLWCDGRLLATYKDGRARLHAYLDDYAFMIDAVLELLQARWNSHDLRFAVELAEVMLAQFEDREHGGFFFTAHDHERLIHRPKPFHDDALPSGNGIAASVLMRLGHLLGESRYVGAAQRTVQAAWSDIEAAPHACEALLLALEELMQPGQNIIIRGAAEILPTWQARLARDYAPQRLCLAIPDTAVDVPAALACYSALPGKVTAYVCNGTKCLPPIHHLDALAEVL